MHGSLRSAIAGLAIVVVMILALAPSTLAAQGTRNYHGTFDPDGAHFFCGGIEVPAAVLDGVWNLNVRGSQAVVTMNVSYDGRHHTSFGSSGGIVTATDTGLRVKFGTMAVASLAGGVFEWQTPTDADCVATGHDSVVFVGRADR